MSSLSAALHAFQTGIQAGTLRPDLVSQVRATEENVRRLAINNPAALRRPSSHERLAALLCEEA